MSISKKRGVTVADLTNLHTRRGVQLQDYHPKLGISMSRWTQIKKHGKATLDPDTLEPVKPGKSLTPEQINQRLIDSPQMALLVRWMSDPTVELVRSPPSPQEMLDAYNAALPTEHKLTPAQFAAIHGHQRANGMRWMQGTRVSRQTSQLMLMMWDRFKTLDPADRTKMLLDWIEQVKAEAMARGVPDILLSLTWNKEVAEQGPKTKRKPRT